MQEFVAEIKKTAAGMCALLLVMAGCAWLLGHVDYIPGLLLGNATSILYYLFICHRVKKSAGLTVPKAIAYMRTGWLVRLSFVVLMLVLSLKIPMIHFGAAVAGLFSLQIVLFFKAVLLISKNFTSK